MFWDLPVCAPAMLRSQAPVAMPGCPVVLGFEVRTPCVQTNALTTEHPLIPGGFCFVGFFLFCFVFFVLFGFE